MEMDYCDFYGGADWLTNTKQREGYRMCQDSVMIALSNTSGIRRLKHPIILLVFFLTLFFLTVNMATPEITTPNILILTAYHQGEDWSDNQIEGVRIKLREAYSFLVPSIEHMDTKRFPDPEHLLLMKQYLRSKYQGKHFDLIMTLDNSALNLVLKFGDELFPGVPIVFAGVNGYRPEMLEGRTNITGVAEVQDMAGTLGLALKVHPLTKSVLAVHDYTSSGIAVHSDMASAADRFKNRLTVDYTPEGTVDDLISQLKALPQDAVVMLLTYVTDKNGRTLTREESSRIITSASPVPVYAMHETRLGYGIVGGMLLEGIEHGKQAADQALRILAGESISRIPVENSRSRPVFDQNVLYRFEISAKLLPADSIIVNQPVSLWRQYRTIWLSGGTIIAVLMMATVFLSRTVMRMHTAEKSLRDALQLNKEIIDSAQEGVIVYDLDLRYRVWNPFMEKLSGISAKDVLGRQPLAVFPFLKETLLMEHLGRALAGETPDSIDFPFPLAEQGLSGWTSDQSSPLRNANGDIIGVIATVRDITGRKLEEKELLKQKYFLQKAQEIGSIGTWELEIQKNELIWTDENYRIFGLPIGTQLTYETFLSFVHPDDRDSVNTKWKASLTGKPYDIEHRLVVDGKTKWVREKAELEFDENGECVRGTGFTQDITERKQAEIELRESEEKFRNVAEQSFVGFYIIQDGLFKYVNPKFADIFGYTVEECLDDMHFRQLVHTEDLATVQEQVRRRVDGEISATQYTFRGIKKTGEIIQSAVYESSLIYKGRPAAIGNMLDVTKEVEMEKRLAQSHRMEAIGTLAGGIAHDFNNTLYPLLGFAELLKEDLPKDSPLQEHIDEILRATLRSKDLVKQILAFSRKSDPNTKPIHLHPVIKEALKLLRSSIPTTIDIQQDIYSDCGVVMADPTQIHEIVMNLATNAYHAMEDSGGKLSVSLRQVDLVSESNTSVLQSLAPGPYALLTVSDTGTGIEKDILDKIFEPYFTTKEVGKGTGLGLSVVHGIVKSHNGDIRISSVPGKWTEICVYLPIIERPVNAIRIEDSEPLPGGTEKILLVDDETPIVRVEQRMLEKLGYHVTTHNSGLEALTTFHAYPTAFDLVLTDMTMPNMTGIQLAEKLFSIRPDIPIILCTGYNEKITEEKARAIGIKRFLMKPVDKSEMAKIVRKVLDEAKG